MKKTIMTTTIVTLMFLAMVFVWPCIPFAAEKPITLKFAHHSSPRNPFWKNGIAPLCKELETKSQGRIKVQFYHAGALLKAVDMWDGTVKGITDMSWTVFSYTPMFPLLSDLSGLPFSYPRASIGGLGQLKMYREGLLDKELDKAIILGLDPTSPAVILSKKPIRSPADMKGKSFRAAGEIHSKVVKSLGGSPIALPIGDAYVALERGVIDGALTACAPALAFKLHEVAKNVTPLQLGGLATGLVMNKARYKALPKDLQQIVDEVMGGEASTRFMGKADDAFEQFSAKKAFPKAGVNFVSLSDAERSAFYKPAEANWSDWVNRMESKGLPAKKVIDRWTGLMKELGYTIPIKPY